LPVIPIKLDADKQGWAQAVTPLIEAGNAFLPESTPLVEELIDAL
jgi:phage terminase large subunit-like protein